VELRTGAGGLWEGDVEVGSLEASVDSELARGNEDVEMVDVEAGKAVEREI
jgi:hypothetical protein